MPRARRGIGGYDSAFLAACRDDLAISAPEFESSEIFLDEQAGVIGGYYQLVIHGDGAGELDALFVEPSVIGQGVGKRLWRHAVALAAARGCRELSVQSDPFAEGFYRAMGAERVGETESTVQPGRMLPQLRFALDAGA